MEHPVSCSSVAFDEGPRPDHGFAVGPEWWAFEDFGRYECTNQSLLNREESDC